MIDKDNAFEVLVQAFPPFASIWQAHLASWGNDCLYIAAGEFVEHLVATGAAERAAVFPSVATAIERLCIEGTPWARDLATVGVLEGVQNVCANRGLDPEMFGGYLLPIGRQAWDELNRNWGQSDTTRSESMS